MNFERFREDGDDAFVSFGRVQFSYQAATAEDISVNVNDHVAILKKDEGGWSRVVLGPHAGYVPANYLQEVSTAQYLTATVRAISRSASSIASSSTTDNNHLGDTDYEAVADYSTGDGSQVALMQGDSVKVLDKTSADWWHVRVNGSNETGFAPTTYLRPSFASTQQTHYYPAHSVPPTDSSDASPADFSGGELEEDNLYCTPEAVVMQDKATAHRRSSVHSVNSVNRLQFISPLEKKRREERKQYRAHQLQEQQGQRNNTNGRRASTTSSTMSTEDLKRQIHLMETALEAVKNECSELNREIAHLSEARPIEDIREEHERLVQLVTVLKTLGTEDGTELADMAMHDVDC
eukprot:m.169077 g.169077  ORF g.169077 m.169077 type:complete len:350 (-) comp13050_c0_seq1:222-1271(-)